MKLAAILFFLLISELGFSQTIDINEIRQLYVNALEKKDASERLFFLTKDGSIKSNLLTYSYHAIAYMLLAKHANNPTKKWQYFKKGKEMLESAISQNPENVEIRFLRYCVQSNSPFFLNYQNDLEYDKKLIIKNINDQPEQLQLFINPIFNKL